MISVCYPEIVRIIRDVPVGLIPIDLKESRFPTLIIKATKEVILTARMNQGFSIYVVPIEVNKTKTYGLISAFFDSVDEPLVIFTPLIDDPINPLIFETVFSKNTNVHFFDENCKEYLGYSAKINFQPEIKESLKNSVFLPADLSLVRIALDRMLDWFIHRTEFDDKAAISVSFTESLMPEDIVIQDVDPQNFSYYGANELNSSELVREEPGPFQERDIVELLQKIFSAEYIYLNPLQVTNREEIADILVYTPTNILLIQAKDSPNTEPILRNTITRKKATASKSLKKALRQTKGAVRYISLKSDIGLIIGNDEHNLEIGSRKIRTLIIVKELFNDEFAEYSPPIIATVKSISTPCIALDYAEFNLYTSRLADEKEFFDAYDKVYSHGVLNGEFPRLRILPTI